MAISKPKPTELGYLDRRPTKVLIGGLWEGLWDISWNKGSGCYQPTNSLGKDFREWTKGDVIKITYKSHTGWGGMVVRIDRVLKRRLWL